MICFSRLEFYERVLCRARLSGCFWTKAQIEHTFILILSYKVPSCMTFLISRYFISYKLLLKIAFLSIYSRVSHSGDTHMSSPILLILPHVMGCPLLEMKVFWPHNFLTFTVFQILDSNFPFVKQLWDIEKHAVFQGIKIIQVTSVINYLSKH